MSQPNPAAPYFYNGPISSSSSSSLVSPSSARVAGSARSAGPILPPMALQPLQSQSTIEPQQQQINSARRPTKLAGIDANASLPILTAIQPQSTTGGQLDPLPFAPRLDSAPIPYAPYAPPPFAPFTSGPLFGSPSGTLPVGFSPSVGLISDSDPFSAQLANRRYNLMIRAAPNTTGTTHRPQKAKKGDDATIEPGTMPSAGPRRSHFLNDAAMRNSTRLQRMFGANSSYAKRQRRQREKEEATAATKNTQQQNSQRRDNAVKAEEKQPPMEVTIAAAPIKQKSEPQQRIKKKIHSFLTGQPASHHFFDHLAGAPLLTDKHLDRIYDSVGSAALQHMRILESNKAKFDSMQDLINSIVQSENIEREARESERNRELALAKGLGIDDPEDNHHQAFKSDQERAIQSVTQRDRDRLVAYLTSTPLMDGDTIIVKSSDGGVASVHGVPMAVPTECRLFGESEFVSATPRELSELIVEGGGIDSCIGELIRLDQVSGRSFDNFSQLLFAMHLAQLDAQVARKTKDEMREYFRRGEEIAKKEAQRRANKATQATRKGAAHTHTSTTGMTYTDEKDDDAISPPSPTSPNASLLHGANRRVGGPLTCHLFLHLASPPVITARDIDRIYDESTAGRDTITHLRAFEAQQVKAQSVQQLIDLILDAHMAYLKKNKLYMISFAATSKQDRNEVLKEINSPECTLFVRRAGSDSLSPSSSSAIVASSDEVAILISECESVRLTLSYLNGFSLKGLHFPDMESCIFELKRTHAKVKKELLRFFRDEACGLFRKEGEEANQIEAGIDASATPIEDAALFTMSLMARLLVESGLDSSAEVFTYLIHLNDTGATFATFADLIRTLQEASKATAHKREQERREILEFLSSNECQLLPRELQLVEADVLRLCRAGGDDTLTLLYYLNDSKKCYSSIEDLIGSVKDESMLVPQHKLSIFMHLLSQQSNLFERLAWDAALCKQQPTSTQRVNYTTQIAEFIETQRKQHTSTLQPAALGPNKPAMSMYQLVEEAAAAETRARLAALTGQELDVYGRVSVVDPARATAVKKAHATFGTDFTHGVSIWTAPTMTLTVGGLSPPAGGIIRLTPSDISRLYRDSLAGPLTLTYLWKLEVDRAHFLTVADLIDSVKAMHADHRLKQSTERHLLVAELLQTHNAFLFTHPIRVTELEVEGLLGVFHAVAPTLFHLHHLRTIERQYSSLQELCSDMLQQKHQAEAIQREVLAYLRHPLCHLLSPEVMLNLDSCSRLFYDSQTGFALPFYLQVLDGRSGGKMDPHEQRRRLRQYERARDLGDNAGEHRSEERKSKYASITELSIAIKQMKDAMADVEARCLSFLNTGRAAFFQPHTQQTHPSHLHSPVHGVSHTRLLPSGSEASVYTIGGVSSHNPSLALVATAGSAPVDSESQPQPQPVDSPKVWTIYEVSRLLIEGECGVDGYTHLVSLQNDHLSFRRSVQDAQLAAASQGKQSGCTKEEIAAATDEAHLIATMGLTPPTVYTNIDDLIVKLQAMQRTLVQQRNQDKSVVNAFVSQSPAENALMSAQFHTANHMRRGVALDGGPEFQSPSTSLIPSASDALIPSAGDLIGAASGVASSGAGGDLFGALDLHLSHPLSSGGLAHSPCVWHSDEIDQLYSVGQGHTIGPSTLLYLVELERENRCTGRKFHNVNELLDAIRQMKLVIARRKQEILEYLIEFAPRFWCKKVSKSVTSPKTKKYAPATKVAKVDTRLAIRANANRNEPLNTNNRQQPTFFIPTIDDVHTLYEHAGAGAATLPILRDFEFELVGRRPFTGLEDLIAAVNAEHVRRTTSARAKERELVAFLSNPLGCPLFSTPQVFHPSSVDFLIGCSGSPSAGVFFVQQLAESVASTRKMNNILELIRAVRIKKEELMKEVDKIQTFLTQHPGRTLLYGNDATNNNPANLGHLHTDSVVRLYIDGGAGAQSLAYLQTYVLNHVSFASSFVTSGVGPLTALIHELARTKAEEAGEFRLLKQRVFGYLRGDSGYEVDGTACDLFTGETITSSFQHSKLVQPNADFSGRQSTALVLAAATHAHTPSNDAHLAAVSTIPASITYNDVNHLFHSAQSGKYTLDYLHTFNMELRSFATLDALIAALQVHHAHMQQLKGQIYNFFMSTSSIDAAAECADLPPIHLFEASPYEITMNSTVVDQIMADGRCGEDTLSYLYGFEASHLTFQTVPDLIAELQAIHQSKQAKLTSHRQKLLDFIASPQCQLFRQSIQITDYHLELLVEAGRKSVSGGSSAAAAAAQPTGAAAPNPSNGVRASPSQATLAALTYLNSQLHWFTTPKALVIGVRQTLAEIVDAKRRTFKWINSIAGNTATAESSSSVDVGECTLWSPSSASASLDSDSVVSSVLSSGGRTGKTKRAALGHPSLRFSTSDLNQLFEDSESGPETFSNLLRMATLGMKFMRPVELITAAKQFHHMQLQQRKEVLDYIHHPKCTIFSKCPNGYVFLLTLSDARRLIDAIQADQTREEEEEQKQADKPGSVPPPARSYASTLMPASSPNPTGVVTISPPDPRVLRLLKELSEIGKKVFSFGELVHVLQQSSFELTQREDRILAFLNDSTRCRFFAAATAAAGHTTFNRAHVRRLLHEVALYNYDGPVAAREANKRQAEEEHKYGASKEQSEFDATQDLPSFLPPSSLRSSDPFSVDDSYLGVGDCLLLLWNLNAGGRTFQDLSELIQAVKTEYLLASEFVIAQGAANRRDGPSAATDLGRGSVASQSLIATNANANVSRGSDAAGQQDMLITPPSYLDQLALHRVNYAGSPRTGFSWAGVELEYLFEESYLSPALLTSSLKVKYLEWQNGKQTLMHFFKRKNNPIFATSAASSNNDLVGTLQFLQTESGVNHVWYGSGAREYCINYLTILIDQQRTFESLEELLRTLKSMHRKRLLQAKLHSIIATYDESIASGTHQPITDAQRKVVIDFLSSDASTIFRPVSPAKLPGQEPLQVERDPNSLPTAKPKPNHTGVNLTKPDVDQIIRTSGHSLNLTMLYLRYLSKFSRSFTSISELLPVLRRLHLDHTEMCKATLKFFYQSDCMLLNYNEKEKEKEKEAAHANTTDQRLILSTVQATAPLESDVAAAGDVAASLTRASADEAELVSLDLRGLNGGGSSSGVDLSLNDMSLLIREATGGMPVLPHLLNFDAARKRFRTFAELIAAVRTAQHTAESEASMALHHRKYLDACHDFLASPWCGLFTDTIHSKPIRPNQHEVAALLESCAGSTTALLMQLHVLNQQGRKFRDYGELHEALLVASDEANQRKKELFQWLRSADNKLFSHALDGVGRVVDASGGSSAVGSRFDPTWSEVTRLFEETDAASDTLAHLYTLNTLGAKFYKFNALVDAVTEQHEKLKVARAESIAAARKKEGKALIRSFLLEPSTHLFSVPVQLNDGHISQLYDVGESGETAVGIRLLGKRTRPGAATVHCLQSLAAMRTDNKDKFTSYADLFAALEGASINLILDRSASIGIGEVAHKPPTILQGHIGQVINGENTNHSAGEGASTATTLASVSGVAPFLLSAADKDLLLQYLSSPSCSLFASLASSPIRHTLAIKTSDLQSLVQAAGDGQNALLLLKRLDTAGRQFDSFESLLYAVKVESIARPPPATITPDECIKLLSYLSKSFLLYDRADLAHKLSKSDLLSLVESSGGTVDRLFANLQDMTDNVTQLVPSSNWSQFVAKVDENWMALMRMQREVLAYLLSVEAALFTTADPTNAAPPSVVLTAGTVEALILSTGSGRHTLSYLIAFARAGNTFASLKELIVSLRSAHIATQNIKAADCETEKSKLLRYLTDSRVMQSLETGPVASSTSLVLSDADLREMISLAGSGQAAIAIIKRIIPAVTAANTKEIMHRFKQEIIKPYA